MAMTKRKTFHEKVRNCQHSEEDLYPDYYEEVSCKCGTPFCEGKEEHCKKCGAFLISCLCSPGFSISGWSEARWKKYYDKKKRS